MSGMELHIPLLIKNPERYHIHLCLTVLTPQMTTFLELTIPWVHCQTVQGIKLAREYPKLSNLTLGMSNFTSHDASNIIFCVNRYHIRCCYDHIMINRDLCGPSNCLDLCPLTLLKGDCLFSLVYFHMNLLEKCALQWLHECDHWHPGWLESHSSLCPMSLLLSSHHYLHCQR